MEFRALLGKPCVNSREVLVIDWLMERILEDKPVFERDDETQWGRRYREIQRVQRQLMRSAGIRATRMRAHRN